LIPLAIIQQKYASLSDAELCNLARESTTLTQEAFIALKREFRKRQLDKALLLQAENQRVEAKQERIRENLANTYERHLEKIWVTAMEGKQNRLSDEEIVTQLRMLGLSYEEANEVLLLLPGVVKELLPRAGQQMKRCGGASVLGIFGLFLAFTSFDSLPLSLLYVAGALLLYGGIGFFKAESQFQTCRQVQLVLEEEGREEEQIGKSKE
jgi:hypothetical protein